MLMVSPSSRQMYDVKHDTEGTMARRESNRLTANAIKQAGPGHHADGNGLYLRVSPSGSKTWVFRYRDYTARDSAGRTKLREEGLGPIAREDEYNPKAPHTGLTLIEARSKAHERQVQLENWRRHGVGDHPLALKRTAAAQAVRTVEKAKSITFGECAERYIRAHQAGWSAATNKSWVRTFETYVFPIFGDLPVQAVDTALVTKVIEPVWMTKPETGNKLRGRIESVLDWAKSREYRDGENPARWRGHLENLLPKKTKVRRPEHFAAMPYAEIGDFITRLRSHAGVAPLALEFAILTAARTGEVIGARWSEINLKERIWTIPAVRMKAHREHRVPLSDRAMAILEGQRDAIAGTTRNPIGGDHPATDGFVFPSPMLPGQGLSTASMHKLLQIDMGYGKRVTVHGFRSTFRDWAAERTAFPNEVAELALAHAVGNKVEAAYRRGDMFEKRRSLMDEWARYCELAEAGGAQLLPLRAAN